MAALSRMILKRDANIISNFTAEDLDKLQAEGNCYFRFQCVDWAPRRNSYGMIYANATEARKDGSTVLPGKSCCKSWRDLYDYIDSFGDGTDFAVLVFGGKHVGYGHDGEDVVTPDRFIAAFDARRFMDILNKEYEKSQAEGYSCFAYYLEGHR